MSLQAHRSAIDKLDQQIVQLLNERTRHVLEIGAIKIKAGEEISPALNRLIDARRISLILGLASNFCVLIENWRVEKRQSAVQFIARAIARAIASAGLTRLIRGAVH